MKKQLVDPKQDEKAKGVENLVSQIDDMQKQYDEVLSELKDIKSQLDNIKEKSIKNRVSKFVSNIQEKVEQLQEGLSSIRNQIAIDLKKFNVTSFNKIAEITGLKDTLQAIQVSIKSVVLQIAKTLDGVNKIGNELHAIGEHSKNLGRVLVGKDIKEAANYNIDKGIINAVQKGLKSTSNILENMNNSVGNIIKQLETLEKNVSKEKPSIIKGLKSVQKPKLDEKTTLKKPQSLSER